MKSSSPERSLTELFANIATKKVQEEIVEQIKSLIQQGRLNPGEKLPPERQLAVMFGVGRSSLREAMNTLATLGFIDIKKRRGAFVKNLSEEVLPDSFAQIMNEDRTRVKDLYELRMDLEVGSAYAAASKRQPHELFRMHSLLKKLESQIEAPRLGIEEDIQFHLTIAKATGNLLRYHTLNNLFNRYGHYIDIARAPFLQGKIHNETVCLHHRNIFAHIEAQQPDKAADAMRAHLSMIDLQWDRD